MSVIGSKDKEKKHGGARPGAGRPSKPEAHATPVKDAEKRIADRLPEVLERLFELAFCGDRKISLDASKYLADRVMGKPTQPVSGDDAQAPLRIRVEYADPEPREE
jgi:hypothetical protein